ncbi:hypothetical protein BBM16_16215 [Vibrio parahaemolyticus]|nr:hypothetical protein BBM16_16215 [Vibrio parahaemolyticus]
MDVTVVGIDLAKNVFQVCVCLVDHSIESNQKVRRHKQLDKVRPFPQGTLIAMEACGSSHCWGALLLKSMELNQEATI